MDTWKYLCISALWLKQSLESWDAEQWTTLFGPNAGSVAHLHEALYKLVISA